MTVTLTSEEYYDLRRRAITPEQLAAKKKRLQQALQELFAERLQFGPDRTLPSPAQKFLDTVGSIFEPEGDIYDPGNK